MLKIVNNAGETLFVEQDNGNTEIINESLKKEVEKEQPNE